MRRYDSLFSPTQEGSDVARLNAAGGEAVTVDPETAVLISKALAVSELSNGAYDPTIAPVVQLWDFRSGTAVLPGAGSVGPMPKPGGLSPGAGGGRRLRSSGWRKAPPWTLAALPRDILRIRSVPCCWIEG